MLPSAVRRALLCSLFTAGPLAFSQSPDSDKKQAAATPTWEEISANYQCPQWFKEAKLGIWVHWGPQSLPEWGGGWYAKHMYTPDVGRETFGKRAYPYHLETYGHPSEVGFKDVIHQWKAEKLDPPTLVDYFADLGARYVMVLANHHDHFDLWDSKHHEWNSVDVGPKRNIIGEFEKAIRAKGLKFGVSSHDDRLLQWWLAAFSADKEGPKKGVPYDGRLTKEDGKGLWWEGLTPSNLYGLPPEQRPENYRDVIGEHFKNRHLDLVTRYQPDLIWFDGYGFPYEEHGQELCRHFLAKDYQDNGRYDCIVAGKFKNEPATVRDIERGVADGIVTDPWQGTTTFTSWFLKKDKPLKHSARSLAEVFIDIVSKGGNFLLNVEMKPDGTIPPAHKEVLDGFRDWTKKNGVAIFGTTPWQVHGDNLNSIQRKIELGEIGAADLEAAKKAAGGHFTERTKFSPAYGSDEVRFTQKQGQLFVTVLRPAPGPLALPRLKSGPNIPDIKKVILLGQSDPLPFEQSAKSLILHVPNSLQDALPTVFQLTLSTNK